MSSPCKNAHSESTGKSPNAPLCTVGTTAYRREQMVNVRAKIRVCAHARVFGVAFWDRPGKVTSRAPDAIELHPMLDFACLSG